MNTCTATPFTSLPPKRGFVSGNILRNSAMFPNRFTFPSPSKLLNPVSKPHSHHLLLNTRASMTREVGESTKTELNVTIHRSSLVTPAVTPTGKKSTYLSNIDQILNIRIGLVFFFNQNQDFPPEIVVKNLENAFRKLLVPYDFVAGRLNFDEKGRLEIDCNSAGAGFVVASSESSSLEDLGDLVNPNPDYTKLAVRELPGFRANDQPLFILQITSFKCGGFAMGMSFSHMLFDGTGCKMFFENLASLSGNKPLVFIPENNRRLLSARSPPQVSFTHPEIIKFGNPLEEDKSNEAPLLSSSERLQIKAFRLSGDDIINLKDRAKMGGETTNDKLRTRVTDFNVVAAHIWRSVSLAKNKRKEEDKTASLVYAINIRKRVRPRLPSTYTGNSLFCGYGTTTCKELEKGPFSHLVQLITQAEKRLTDEYIRSCIDEFELQPGFVYGDVAITSWWKLGFNDTIYPWGKPNWCSPVLQDDENNAVVLLPDIEGTGDNGNANGVNIIVSLPAQEMEKFKILFNEF